MRKFIKNHKKIFLVAIFGIYLLSICYYLFLSEAWGRRDILPEYRYNFVPFTEISRYLENIEAIGLGRVVVNLAGNVLAFVPFGMFVYCFLKKGKLPFLRTATVGLLFTVVIECIQLVTRVGICDVDDIMLNFAGVVIGAVLMKLV